MIQTHQGTASAVATVWKIAQEFDYLKLLLKN